MSAVLLFIEGLSFASPSGSLPAFLRAVVFVQLPAVDWGRMRIHALEVLGPAFPCLPPYPLLALGRGPPYPPLYLLFLFGISLPNSLLVHLLDNDLLLADVL